MQERDWWVDSIYLDYKEEKKEEKNEVVPRERLIWNKNTKEGFSDSTAMGERLKKVKKWEPYKEESISLGERR